MNLIYLVFGKRISYHYEAAFSLCSFLAKAGDSVKNVFIYTDAPEFYGHLKNKVRLRVVNEQELKEWKGPQGYFWRVKIKAIEDVQRNNPTEPLVYMDSDTFTYKSPADFEELLAKGNAFMHRKESLLSEASSKTQRRMWKQMQGKTYAGITLNSNHAMWNAGFIAIPAEKQKETIELALNICDAMCAGRVPFWLTEQFSFSLAIQEMYQLFPTENFVGHYWGNKDEWDTVVQNYFMQSHLQGLDLEEEINGLNDFDFGKTAVIRKKKRIHKQIGTFLQKSFPDYEVTYIG